MTQQYEIQLPSFSRGFHLITQHVVHHLNNLPEVGLVNIYIKHTSAGLTINENADPSVRFDLEKYFDKAVPENLSYFDHTLEGPDDMPAHVKTTLAGSSVTIPVTNGKLNLGTWQGIYLCEFRNHATARKLVITVMG
ncbi:MAG: YjbQ family protein [Bacteroidales bacterium]|nr:YjbQ family protein [Bacteroidales bacterium]